MPVGTLANIVAQTTLNMVANNLRNDLINSQRASASSAASDAESAAYFRKVAQVTREAQVSEIGQTAITETWLSTVTKTKNTIATDEAIASSIKTPNRPATAVADDSKGEQQVADSAPLPPETPEDTQDVAFKSANAWEKIVPPVVPSLETAKAAADDNNKFYRSSNVNINDPPVEAGNDTPAQPGQPVKGHDGSLANKFNNTTTFEVPDGNGGSIKYFKSWATKDGKADLSTTGTANEPFNQKLNAMLEAERKTTPGSYKFFIEKLHGKSVDGKFYKKNLITPGQTRDQIPNRMVFPAYIMNFNDNYQVTWGDYKFIGRGEKSYVYEETTRSMKIEFYMMSDFSADVLLKAIADFQESNNSSKAASNLGKLDATVASKVKTQFPKLQGVIDSKGKAVDVGKQPLSDSEIYDELQRIKPDWGDGTTPNSSYIRDNKAGFIQGSYSGTPEQLWARYTFLAQCCYAWYRKDGKLKEQPFVRIRIGDFFDVIAKVDTLDFQQDEFDMDLNPSTVGVIPMGVKVAMSLTIIHEDEPSSDYPRFYWRKDFDGLNVNPYSAPENIRETSRNLDSTLDKNDASGASKPPGSGAFPMGIKMVQESLKNNNVTNSSVTALGSSVVNLQQQKQVVTNQFGKSIGTLHSSGNSTQGKVTQEQIKSALVNAKRLNDINQAIDISKIKSLIPPLSSGIANNSPTDTYPKASIPTTTPLPESGQSLFPQFKSPV
jgi:hypothetical protein